MEVNWACVCVFVEMDIGSRASRGVSLHRLFTFATYVMSLSLYLTLIFAPKVRAI
jgi:hypothetical protein